MAEEWGYSSESSGLEYRKNGLSNEYDLNKLIQSASPEYITIYDSKSSFKSKLLSITMIFSVLVFCAIFFIYLFQDNSPEQQVQSRSSLEKIKK
jgi:hypothetical protein